MSSTPPPPPSQSRSRRDNRSGHPQQQPHHHYDFVDDAHSLTSQETQNTGHVTLDYSVRSAPNVPFRSYPVHSQKVKDQSVFSARPLPRSTFDYRPPPKTPPRSITTTTRPQRTSPLLSVTSRPEHHDDTASLPSNLHSAHAHARPPITSHFTFRARPVPQSHYHYQPPSSSHTPTKSKCPARRPVAATPTVVTQNVNVPTMAATESHASPPGWTISGAVRPDPSGSTLSQEGRRASTVFGGQSNDKDENDNDNDNDDDLLLEDAWNRVDYQILSPQPGTGKRLLSEEIVFEPDAAEHANSRELEKELDKELEPTAPALDTSMLSEEDDDENNENERYNGHVSRDLFSTWPPNDDDKGNQKPSSPKAFGVRLSLWKMLLHICVAALVPYLFVIYVTQGYPGICGQVDSVWQQWIQLESLVVKELSIGEDTLASNPQTSSEEAAPMRPTSSTEINALQAHAEALVHPALIAHPRPQRVAVLGRGESAALRQVLQHDTVTRVHVVGLPLVTRKTKALAEWNNCTQVFAAYETVNQQCRASGSCYDDPRVYLDTTDPLVWLVDHYGHRAPSPPLEELFDVILVDTLDLSFLTKTTHTEFAKEVAYALNRALGSGGILTISQRIIPSKEVARMSTLTSPGHVLNEFSRLLLGDYQHKEEAPPPTMLAFSEPLGSMEYRILFTDTQTPRQWSETNSAEMSVRLAKRLARMPTSYDASAFVSSYQLPNRMTQDQFCLESVDSCRNFIGGLDPSSQIIHASDLKVKTVRKPKVHNRKGVFTKKKSFAKGSYLFLEEALERVLVHSRTLQLLQLASGHEPGHGRRRRLAMSWKKLCSQESKECHIPIYQPKLLSYVACRSQSAPSIGPNRTLSFDPRVARHVGTSSLDRVLGDVKKGGEIVLDCSQRHIGTSP